MACRLQPLFGAQLSVESVTASRLAQHQPYNLIIRDCAQARLVRNDWQVVDARAGKDEAGKYIRVFNIKTIVNPDERNRFIEMLIVEGESS